jgi:hypothetical protein
MKRIRIIGLALVAVLALSAVVASAASAALPEFVASKFPVKFTLTSGAGLLETVGGRQVKCTSDSGSGEILNAKETKNTVVKFKGCTAKGPFGTLECQSGSTKGEIVTKKVKGLLVYDNKAEKKAAILGEGEETGAFFAEFTCTGVLVEEKMKVKGNALGLITPVNTKSTLLKISATMSKGKPTDLAYETDAGVKGTAKTETKGEGSEAFGYEESGLEGTEDLIPAESIEVKA